MTSHPPVFPAAIRQPLPPVSGRGATAWRPWADWCHGVAWFARLIDDCSANGRDAVAPLPAAEQGCSALPRDIFRSQVSALRSQVRVIRCRCGCGAKFRSWTCTRTWTP